MKKNLGIVIPLLILAVALWADLGAVSALIAGGMIGIVALVMES